MHIPNEVVLAIEAKSCIWVINSMATSCTSEDAAAGHYAGQQNSVGTPQDHQTTAELLQEPSPRVLHRGLLASFAPLLSSTCARENVPSATRCHQRTLQRPNCLLYRRSLARPSSARRDWRLYPTLWGLFA